MRSTSVSFSSVVTAFGYLAPYSVAKRVTASRACSRVSACIQVAAFAGVRSEGLPALPTLPVAEPFIPALIDLLG